MNTRVQLNITWSVNIQENGPFSKLDDFMDYAKRVLVQSFANYKAELNFVHTKHFQEDGKGLTDVDMVWDVNLDGVAGAFHNAEDHAQYVQTYLRDMVKFFTYRAKVTSTLRHLDEDELAKYPERFSSEETETKLTAWDPEFREKSYQDFLREMEADTAAA